MDKKTRSCDLEHHRPKDEEKCHLGRSGWPVMPAETEALFEPKANRNCARHQEEVIEPPRKEAVWSSEWLDQPAVDDVKRAAGAEKSVAQVAEALQNSAKMTTPRPVASAALARRIVMTKTLKRRIRPWARS
jgi:hypothetical protein